GKNLFCPTWLRTTCTSRNLRNILDVFRRHVKQREEALSILGPLGENHRSRVGRPGRILARDQQRRVAAFCWHRADVEIAHLRREYDRLSVRRPIRLARIAHQTGAKAVNLASVSADFAQCPSASNPRHKT